MRECNNCDWTGERSECCMLGDIGPLCPECRETTFENGQTVKLLRPIEDAPKDELILLDIGNPWLVVGIWSEANEEFVYADLHVSHFEGKEDPGFESEWEKPERIKGWLPMPQLENQAS